MSKTKAVGQNGQVNEIDFETAMAIVERATEERRQGFIAAYKALCQEWGFQLAIPQHLEVTEIKR